jgi:hypothetical protein
VRHFSLLDMILNCHLHQSLILITDFSDINQSLYHFLPLLKWPQSKWFPS